VVKITDIEPPNINYSDALYVDATNYSQDRLKKYRIRRGDFVIAMTGATIGKIGRLYYDKEMLVNQRVAIFRAKQDVMHEYIYVAISNDVFQTHIINNIDSETAQANISANSIGKFPIIIPPAAVLQTFNAAVEPLFAEIGFLTRENQTLAATRDKLLRKLIK
jgi:type I restriction enzyme S subunit